MKEEQIRNAISEMDPEIVRDALAIVLDSGVRSGASQSSRSKVADNFDFKTFAEALVYLKKNYDFPELKRFTTEADLVYVDTGDRKVLLTKAEDVKRERRYESLRSETEDDFFANAWEPLQKVSPKENKTSSASSVSAAPGVSAVSGGSAGSRDSMRRSADNSASASKSENTNKNDSDDSSSDKKGGRFSLLEL